MDLYSPEQELFNPLFTEKGIRVFIKRDDMIHPFISGNKWRKLKYILAEAEQLQKNHLVTFGGAWSNHLLATACAAAAQGFQSTAFVRGEEVSNPVLDLCRMFGMQLKFTNRESYRNKKELFERHFGSDSHALFIDEGGAGIQAVRGCAELADELKQDYDHIFCAAGTGTTSAGIINGIINRKLQTHFHAVSVFRDGSFLRHEIEKYLLSPFDFTLVNDYHFGGYAKTSAELMLFIKTFAATTGILLDPVYTGKMMFALFDLIRKNTFGAGENIIAVHTGGLTGLLGKLSQIP